MRSYNEAGNASRIHEEANALAALEAAAYDLELAGAWLLGSDALDYSRCLLSPKHGIHFNPQTVPRRDGAGGDDE